MTGYIVRSISQSVDETTLVTNFMAWLNEEWAKVPEAEKATARMSVHGLMHWIAGKAPSVVSVMIGIQHGPQQDDDA